MGDFNCDMIPGLESNESRETFQKDFVQLRSEEHH